MYLYSISAEERAVRDSRAEELLIRMSRGEVDAMGELYELIRTDVFSYALSKLGDRAGAEDILHDTFIQIWKNATLYRPMGKPLAWIFTVEMNLIRRRRILSGRILTLDESVDTGAEEENPADTVINSEMVRYLLSALSEDEREIVILYVVSGLKHREIADLLGKPLSTVISRYNRAMKKLKKMPEGEED